MSDFTQFQIIAMIALGVSLLNLARAWLFTSGGTPATRQPPVHPLRKAPSPLAKPGTPTTTPPRPGSAPVGKQEILPSSLESGLAGHQKAGAAKTVKIPVVPTKGTDGQPATEAMSSPPPATPVVTSKPRISTGGTSVVEGKPSDADAAALDSLFGNSGKSDLPPATPGMPAETTTGAIRRKASRLEELGFHHSIEPDATDPGNKPALTPAPRSSTAELTSILERIDKFLAEDTPPKATDSFKPNEPIKAETAAAPVESTKPVEQSQVKTEPIPAAKVADALVALPAKPDPTKKTQPLWARADAQDEDVKPAAGGSDKGGSDKSDDGKGGDSQKPDAGQQRLF